MKITGNEPAYPVVGESGLCTTLGNIGKNDCAGMTIRTELASRAMQGLMVQCIPDKTNRNTPENNRERAMFAVAMADALIEELNKEKP